MLAKNKFMPFENKVWLATPTQHTKGFRANIQKPYISIILDEDKFLTKATTVM